MDAKKRTPRKISGRLLEILSASETEKEREDETWTDRDGELLPEPPEEAEEKPLAERLMRRHVAE